MDETIARIRADAAPGRVRGIDPQPVAEALIAMSEGYLREMLGRMPQADADTVAATLSSIWLRTLYGASR